METVASLFASRMGEIYEAIYNGEANDLLQGEAWTQHYLNAVYAFEKYIRLHADSDFYKDIIKERGDIISSDRECAAFMFTYAETVPVGYSFGGLDWKPETFEEAKAAATHEAVNKWSHSFAESTEMMYTFLGKPITAQKSRDIFAKQYLATATEGIPSKEDVDCAYVNWQLKQFRDGAMGKLDETDKHMEDMNMSKDINREEINLNLVGEVAEEIQNLAEQMAKVWHRLPDIMNDYLCDDFELSGHPAAADVSYTMEDLREDITSGRLSKYLTDHGYSPTHEPCAMDSKEISDIRWTYADISNAHDNVYGGSLDLNNPDVAAYCEAVVNTLGDSLSDRLCEAGFELIYDALPSSFEEFKEERAGKAALKKEFDKTPYSLASETKAAVAAKEELLSSEVGLDLSKDAR